MNYRKEYIIEIKTQNSRSIGSEHAVKWSVMAV